LLEFLHMELIKGFENFTVGERNAGDEKERNVSKVENFREIFIKNLCAFHINLKMTTVFYPAMGVDIITPLLCCPKVQKIYATGPLDRKRWKKKTLTKHCQFICGLVNAGTNEFFIRKDEDIMELLPDDSESHCLKDMIFKSKQMWYMQLEYFNRRVTLYWYFQNDPDKDPFPFTEQVDYIIHKDYNWDVQGRKEDIVKILKPDTQIIACKSDLRQTWKYSKKFCKKLAPIEEYAHIVEQSVDEPNLYRVKQPWVEEPKPQGIKDVPIIDISETPF